MESDDQRMEHLRRMQKVAEWARDNNEPELERQLVRVILRARREMVA